MIHLKLLLSSQTKKLKTDKGKVHLQLRKDLKMSRINPAIVAINILILILASAFPCCLPASLRMEWCENCVRCRLAIMEQGALERAGVG